VTGQGEVDAEEEIAWWQFFILALPFVVGTIVVIAALKVCYKKRAAGESGGTIQKMEI